MAHDMMSFWDHLEELRRVLLRCLIVVALFAILAFIFKDEVFFLIFAPKSPDFLPFLVGKTPHQYRTNPSVRGSHDDQFLCGHHCCRTLYHL